MIVSTPPPQVRIAPAPLAAIGRNFRARAPVMLRLRVGKLVKVIRTTTDGHGAFRTPLSPYVPAGTCTGNISIIAITRGTQTTTARFARPCVPLSP
jgi:hypothetical protein